MRRAPLALVCAAAISSLCACVPATHYAWGGYDQALYTHYKSPQDRGPFIEQLRLIIASSQQAGQRVPPGIYAEYGYMLFEEGRIPEAVSYFQKEQKLWPESGAFMAKMIRNAERLGAPSAPAQSSPAVPAAKGNP